MWRFEGAREFERSRRDFSQLVGFCRRQGLSSYGERSTCPFSCQVGRERVRETAQAGSLRGSALWPVSWSLAQIQDEGQEALRPGKSPVVCGRFMSGKEFSIAGFHVEGDPCPARVHCSSSRMQRGARPMASQSKNLPNFAAATAAWAWR
jgi:hypothetical protein